MIPSVKTGKFSELSVTELDAWLGIVNNFDRFASPYFHPFFVESCVRVGREVNVSVIKSDGGVAFFPFEVKSKNQAGPVGGIMSDFQGIISSEGTVLDLWDVVKLSGLKTYTFDHFVNGENIPSDSISAISPVIDISDGYEEYRARKIEEGSKLFKKIDKLKDNAERNLGPLRYEHNSYDKDLLEVLVKLKSEQYVRSEIIDLFGFDWARSLVSAIFKVKEEDFKGVLSCLYAGENLIFAHFGMQTKRRFHYWFPAYPVEHSSYSPGIIGLDYLVQATACDKICAIDLGKGDNLYKSRFANAESIVFEGKIMTSGYEKLKSNILAGMERTVKASPLIHKCLYPLRIVTRNYRQTRKYR